MSLTSNSTIYPLDIAQEYVNELNADQEDNWTYKVKQLGYSQKAKIEIYDETGEFVEYF